MTRAPYLKVHVHAPPPTHTHTCTHTCTNTQHLTYTIYNHSPLQLYSEYISKFDKSLKTLEDATKKNTLFAEVLHEFEAQPKCSNLPLAGYMLEIVQRIPRYKLLLSGERSCDSHVMVM